MKFTDFNLDSRILEGVASAGFLDCTPVQAESYPISLEGKDLLVQSQTGSGKTAAFLIPIFNKLLKEPGKALIIAPTRELAIQIDEECKKLGALTQLTAACFYGGTGYTVQEKALRTGVDIVIGTPGRLLDFNKSKKINFADFTVIVIDEADRLFDMGFYPDLQKMMRDAKKPAERQTMLFSATLSTRVRQLAWEYMNSPQEVEIHTEGVAVEEINQSIYHISGAEKLQLLLGILKREKPTAVLIFTNTKHQAAVLSQKLNYNGYKSMFMSGDLPQNKRSLAINDMKSGKLSILTATDVAARGLHIDDLPLVINYDVPEDYEVYVHRIGRTARAGKSGKAITLACEKYVFHLEAVENYINKKIPVEWVEDELLAEDLSVGKPIDYSFDPNRSRQNANRGNAPRRNVATQSGGGDYRSRTPRKPVTAPRRSATPQTGNVTRKPVTAAYRGTTPQTGNVSRKPVTAPRRSVTTTPGNTPRRGVSQLAKNATESQRVAYYKAKYGESFTPCKQKKGEKQKTTSPAPRKRRKTVKKSWLSRFVDKFRQKK